MNERLAARQTAFHDGDDNHDHDDKDDHGDHGDHGGQGDHGDHGDTDHHDHQYNGDDDNGDNHSFALRQAVLAMHGLQSLRSEEILMNSDLSKAAPAPWR